MRKTLGSQHHFYLAIRKETESGTYGNKKILYLYSAKKKDNSSHLRPLHDLTPTLEYIGYIAI
jgi:hypothetical protein